jgi:O-antigen ligase
VSAIKPTEETADAGAPRATSFDQVQQNQHMEVRIASEHRNADGFGKFLLLVCFLTLVAGRFTLSRLGALPDLDLRFAFLYLLCCGLLIWYLGRQVTGVGAAKIGVGPGMAWFAAWCVLLAISTFWSAPEARLVDSILNIFFLFVFTLVAIAVASRLPTYQIDSLWIWLIVVAAVFLALAIYSGPGAQGRYAAPGGGPNVFVRFMVMGALAALCRYQTAQRTRALLPVPFFAIGAILSGSRGGLLAALIVLILAGVPVFRRSGLKFVLVCSVAITMAAIGALMAVHQSTAIIRMIRERYVEQTLNQRYTSDRERITAEAWNLFVSHPVIGSGLDGYYASQLVEERFEHPHNLVLATLAESGLLGGLLLMSAVISFLAATLKTRPLTNDALFALVIGIYLFFASMFSGDYYDSRMMWFFLCVAVIESRRAAEGRDASNVREVLSRSPRTASGQIRFGRLSERYRPKGP